MFVYAQLNAEHICVAITRTIGEITDPNVVLITEDSNDYLWKKHIDGTWSQEKYEPINQEEVSLLAEKDAQIAEKDQIILDMYTLLKEGGLL